MAEKFESKLWIIHVAAPDPDFVGYDVGPSYIRDTRAEELRSEHRQLNEMMELARSYSIDCEALLVQGATIEMLEEEIEKLHIDLIIIGSHEHSFLYELFIGHTSVKLLKRIQIPLMIVPADEK